MSLVCGLPLSRLPAILFAAWAMTASVVSGFVFGTLLVLPFVVLPRGRRERYTIVGAGLWARFVVRWVLWCRVRVAGQMPVTGGALLVCNHRSWLDPLLLVGWTRSNGLSKRSIIHIPFVGWYGWLAGAVFFERSDPEDRARARREVRHLIDAGHRIQVFPEGTRSLDGKLREKVFLNLVRDAWSAGHTVVPCAVAHTERVLPARAILAHPGQTVDLRIGEAMSPADHPDADSFALAAWAGVSEAAG